MGVALSTSEVSFEDSAYIEMESGTLNFPCPPERVYTATAGGGGGGSIGGHGGGIRKERKSESTTDSSERGCCDGDWSPLSTPRG